MKFERGNTFGKNGRPRGSKNRLTARVLEDMNQVWTELVSEGTAALPERPSLDGLQPVLEVEKQLMAWHKSNPVSQRLASVPGIGPIIATAIAATVVEQSDF
jgi:hypothetical protein